MGVVPAREYGYSRVSEGSVVGRLHVKEKTSCRSKNGSVLWRCICECGKEVLVQSSTLNKGLKQSCGCLERETYSTRNSTHGLSSTREYNSWTAMKQRCYYQDHEEYHNYGGRGIQVCEEWKYSFENFIHDMGPAGDGESIDRKDVNKGYSKENCRWASASVQGFNTRKKQNNTSGRTGVSWHTRLNKWCAFIGVNNRVIHLGSFDYKSEAIAAREAAELKFFGKAKE